MKSAATNNVVKTKELNAERYVVKKIEFSEMIQEAWIVKQIDGHCDIR